MALLFYGLIKSSGIDQIELKNSSKERISKNHSL